MKQSKVTPATIVEKELFFSIPIYQRIFEWTSEDVELLVSDLLYAFKTSEGQADYYIGIITSTSKHELVDGQQRFTALMLLGSVLAQYDDCWNEFLFCKERVRLHFSSRPKDNAFLKDCVLGKDLENNNYQNTNMAEGIRCIKKALKECDSEKKFARYVFEHLAFFIAELPESYSGKELNLYFERMNGTGKNLEKWEILKVKLLSHLTNNRKQFFDLWNKIADIDIPLISYKEISDSIFDESYICCDSFFSTINKDTDEEGKTEENGIKNLQAIGDIEATERKKSRVNKNIDFSHGRFALRFPQLLLNTLYWFITQDKNNTQKITIDDFFNESNMLRTFNKYLPYEGPNVDKIKIEKFVKRLVVCRIALDYCFIRVMDNDYRIYLENDNTNDKLKKLLMYESMLYVSASNLTNYKWFGWLMDSVVKSKGLPKADDLYNDLRKLDNKENTKPTLESLGYNKETRYWFWRLDFYIWLNRNQIFLNDEAARRVAENYVFIRNRSIEHIAPQHPKNNSDFVWNEQNKEVMNCFGNLAMISQGLNSKLSNEAYELKKAHVKSYCDRSFNGSIESLKLLAAFSKHDIWNEQSIKEHQEEMYKILSDSYPQENV